MKVFPTLLDGIRSELIKQGKNEFYVDGKYVANNKDYRFIQKAMRYDEDVEQIVTDMFFAGYRFPSSEVDRFFKKAFVNRFLTRQIGRQTFESFASQVVFQSLICEQEVEAIFHNFSSVLANENKTESTNTGENVSENINQGRDIDSTLPQDQINLDLSDFHMDYADSNSISKSKTDSRSNNNQKSTTSATNYNAETFKSLQGLWDNYFKEYDRRCFLHVW